MTQSPVAVVTGASRRLGFETCVALIERGYSVYALFRTDTTELELLRGKGARCLPVDLADALSVSKAIESIVEETDNIRLLVNNASEFLPDETEAGGLARQAARLFQINSIAPMQLMAGLASSLCREARQAGRPSLIINITDIYTEKPNPKFASYCASKAALSNLTLSYAKLLAPHVRVNAIMPGPISFLPTHSEEHRAGVMTETLLPWEGGFNSVVIQLLAMLDNDFMTAALIPVDGGRRLT
jgi:dihydromonapterin reductase / dihydrofolate reductase